MIVHRFAYALMCASVAAACGGGGHDVDPERIPGGGVADPGIDGEVNVHVVDEDTDEPIQGATVHVGDLEGETDADGLFVATDVSGPQTITVIAAGHVASTWVGVDGANVTIPVPRPNDNQVAIDQGAVTGTIDGWDAMVAPQGRALIAFTGYSANHDDDDPANEIEQPATDPPPNACFKVSGTEPCNWSLQTRTGQMAIFALLGDIGADQVVNITGFAYATGVVVEDGETVGGVTLEVASATDLVEPDLTLPTAPSGTTRVQALVRMDLGDDGRLLLPQTAELAVPVPDASLFPGSSYELIGFADDGDDDGDGPTSVVIERGLASVETASVPAFLAVPQAVETDAATFSFEAVEGATLHVFSVHEADDTSHWNVAVLDGSTEVALPAHVTLPDGSLVYEVNAIEIPGIDLQDFSIDAIQDTVTRSSTNEATFSN